MPQKTATEWERATNEVDRAEWRLLDRDQLGGFSLLPDAPRA